MRGIAWVASDRASPFAAPGRFVLHVRDNREKPDSRYIEVHVNKPASIRDDQEARNGDDQAGKSGFAPGRRDDSRSISASRRPRPVAAGTPGRQFGDGRLPARQGSIQTTFERAGIDPKETLEILLDHRRESAGYTGLLFIFLGISGRASLPKCADTLAIDESARRLVVYRQAAVLGFATLQPVAIDNFKLGDALAELKKLAELK